MKTLIFVGIVMLSCAFLPAEGEAYFTTDQDAFTVNGKTGVYTIEFAFGHDKHDIYIPAKALHGSTAVRNALSYELVDKNGGLASGTAVGIVLSSLPVRDGMYRIPKGKAARFTLLVLYTPPMNDGDYRAQVTSLPFTFDGATKLQLNPSELQYYTTDYLSLDRIQVGGK